MRPVIRSLYATGLFLGAFVIASPAAASAQGKGRGQEKSQQVEKGQQKIEKMEEKADREVTKSQQVATRRAARHTRRTSRVARTRYLCDDGSWSYSTICSGHGGPASRQYSPVPRASEQGILHANERSAVARAYANRTAAGAIARCNDGSYWHALTRTGSCADHGGVRRWL